MIKISRSALFALALFISAPAFFVRCGQKVQEVKDEEITHDSASTDAKLKLDQIFVNIPTPIELTKELAKSGFNYTKGILNSSTGASAYSTNYKAAANLGIYGADLGYTTSYGQTQDALGYLNSIKQLADKVGVGAAFDANMAKHFEGNISNKDTLEFIINSAYDKASRNLRSNQRVATAAVCASGGWVEGLYITTKVLANVSKTEKNEAVFQRVWSQLFAYKYVNELLTIYEKNPDCAQMMKDLSSIAEVSKKYSTATTVTPEDVKLISEKISAIRNGMVN